MNIELFRNICGVVSTVLAIFTTVPYIRSILQRRTKPHQFSFLVFSIMYAITITTQFLEGARQSLLVPLVFFVGTTTVFVLSMFYGTRNTSTFDRLLFGMALFTIMVWALTENNVLAIWLTVIVDLFATGMILLKVRAEPHTEDPVPWVISVVAYLFSALALAGMESGIIYVRPLYGIASTGLVAWYIYNRLTRHRRLVSETSLMQ